MSLSVEEVKHIAELGRLSLTEDEVGKFSKDLNSILGYIETLQELNTDGVEPMIGAVEFNHVVRADEVVQTSDELRAKILDNAPDSEETAVKVPQMNKQKS